MKRWMGGLVVLATLVGWPLRRLPADAGPPANGCAVLLTDYGSNDAYPGILKGVIARQNPVVRIHDATHDVPNFDIAAAAYMLGRIAPEWPDGTVFCIVVDPGVGTVRRRIAVRTLPDGKVYVCPDNGVLTDVLAKAASFEARELTNPKLKRPGSDSDTFHGRDWFGPVTGHLSGGLAFSEVGPVISGLHRLPRVAARREGGEVVGTVVYVDHYGNLLTNIPHELLVEVGWPAGAKLEFRVAQGNWIAAPWVRTYGDVPRGQWLVTTHNAERGVEVAINYGHAGAKLGVRSGQALRLRRAGSR
ncbi:MAG: SAM-dependent chlorinase/fluorinase [Fimbriimonadaceae bacterium]|nr:SAM-dependent chlorinase/fluorinase [Fimbriimonadaceae bacterium]